MNRGDISILVDVIEELGWPIGNKKGLEQLTSEQTAKAIIKEYSARLEQLRTKYSECTENDREEMRRLAEMMIKRSPITTYTFAKDIKDDTLLEMARTALAENEASTGLFPDDYALQAKALARKLYARQGTQYEPNEGLVQHALHSFVRATQTNDTKTQRNTAAVMREHDPATGFLAGYVYDRQLAKSSARILLEQDPQALYLMADETSLEHRAAKTKLLETPEKAYIIGHVSNDNDLIERAAQQMLKNPANAFHQAIIHKDEKLAKKALGLVIKQHKAGHLSNTVLRIYLQSE